jgi:hypothetical protein
MANAQAPAATDAEISAANAAKAAADAEKAAADARKAQADAELAAFKAQVGEVPAGPYHGDVDLRDRAGAMEAALLAAKATNVAATTIATAVKEALASKGKHDVLLYAAGDVPTFKPLVAFRAQTALVGKALADAISASKKADAAAPPERTLAVPPAGAVGVGLDAVNKLLGYFRTDYAIGGIELASDDSVLVQALASRIAKEASVDVRVPGIYDPVPAEPAGAILARLTELSTAGVQARSRVASHEAAAKRFTEAKPPEPAKAAIHQNAADGLKSALTLADGLVAKLGAADDKGVIPLVAASREASIAEALAGGSYLLVVKLHRTGGAYYKKSNLWTFLGGMPLFHMGGAVTGYLLLEGATGKVVASGVVPVHGGFVKAGALEGEL